MNPYTVVFTLQDDPIPLWEGFNCRADDPDHAEEQCFNAYPNASIVWVNTGFNNFHQD